MRTCYFGAAGVCSKIDNLMLVDVSDSDWLMDVQWISAIAVEVEWNCENGPWRADIVFGTGMITLSPPGSDEVECS